MTLTDKTGSPVSINKETDRFTVGVEGRTVGHVTFAERDGRRVFVHTKVDDDYTGRGLASLLIGEALSTTRTDGQRIVAVCEMVAAYIDKHPEFADITDEATPEMRQGLPE